MKIVPKQGIGTRASANTVVTLAEMRSICYIDAEITDDDTMLVSMELAARNLCEKFLGRFLLTTTQTLYYQKVKIEQLFSDNPNLPTLYLPGGVLQLIGVHPGWTE